MKTMDFVILVRQVINSVNAPGAKKSELKFTFQLSMRHEIIF
jgi:hypothetical protein